VLCSTCGAAVDCADAATEWRLYESIGDSEWEGGEAVKARFLEYAERLAPTALHSCINALDNAAAAISVAQKASELAAVAPKPKLRFAELVWRLGFADKRLLKSGGYFWRCAALRYALHAVNVANEVATEEEMLPLFESAAELNCSLWRALECSWLDRPLVLGCLISQIRCDAWLASFKMENARVGSETHRAKVEDAMRRAQTICSSLFGECRAPHAMAQDLVRTIKDVTGQ
jgi:hypothetical protein